VINGKVIRGDLSFLVVVDSTDSRLKGEGLPGATVQIGAVTERGPRSWAAARPMPKGNVRRFDP